MINQKVAKYPMFLTFSSFPSLESGNAIFAENAIFD